MTTRFKTIKPADIRDNPFRLIDQDWTLITAGTLKSFNTMTASWGGLGTLWNKPVAFVFVRPTRYTYGFMEREPRFTLSFFAGQYRQALLLCGTKSGRRFDKVSAAGLTPARSPLGSVLFREARLVLECRKLYCTDLDPRRFIVPSIAKFYPKRDYHRLYVGEIRRVLTR
jgi:flavin reductase (DIM6/NTAB) family NADH-FMN oxidoreductase RutF